MLSKIAPPGAMAHARLRLRLALCIIVAIAALLAVNPAHAQSALEFAASGMGARVETAQVIVPLRARGRHRVRRPVTMLAARTRAIFAQVAAPLDIRTAPQLIAVAQRYIGARRFTAHARAWCADALGVWLHKAGYSNTGDGRAISYLRYGHPAPMRVGAIAVLKHHVGIVADVTPRGVVLLSGNHGRKVGYGLYSARRILAFRWPV